MDELLAVLVVASHLVLLLLVVRALTRGDGDDGSEPAPDQDAGVRGRPVAPGRPEVTRTRRRGPRAPTSTRPG